MHTARAVRDGGGQLEIVLRVRHAHQPLFGFIQPEDSRHSFFRWLVANGDLTVERLHLAGAPPPERVLTIMRRLAAESAVRRSDREAGRMIPCLWPLLLRTTAPQISCTPLPRMQKLGSRFEARVAKLMGTSGSFGFLAQGSEHHATYRYQGWRMRGRRVQRA